MKIFHVISFTMLCFRKTAAVSQTVAKYMRARTTIMLPACATSGSGKNREG